MVLFSQASGKVPVIDINILNAKGSLIIIRPSLFHYIADNKSLQNRAFNVLSPMALGSLKLCLKHVFPLENACKAQNALEGRKTTGKVFLAI